MLTSDMKNPKLYSLSQDDIDKIEVISENRYRKKEWVFGNNPKATFEKTMRFLGGTIEVKLNIEKNKIVFIKISGDFFSKNGIEEIEKKLVGVQYFKKNIKETLEDFKIEDYFTNISLENILEVMF